MGTLLDLSPWGLSSIRRLYAAWGQELLTLAPTPSYFLKNVWIPSFSCVLKE